MPKPAARLGDPTSHGVNLIPGPASPTVKIGGQPAWRCNVDMAVCPTPIAPPNPAPHGVEICYFGSLSVVINRQMAVRSTDLLVAAAPPNPIGKGEGSVQIGDWPFGLADPYTMSSYCADFGQLVQDWAGLTPEERVGRLQEIIGKSLLEAGVPPRPVTSSDDKPPGHAAYRPHEGLILVSQQTVESPTLGSKAARRLANALYHEGRHAEQHHHVARRRAGLRQGAEQSASERRRIAEEVASETKMPPGFVWPAASDPLVGQSAESNLADAVYESLHGSRAEYNRDVMRNIDDRYGEYRALPQEHDASATADALPCGKE